MATILIKDLPDNLDLDRKAMQAITGGARLRSPIRTPVRPRTVAGAAEQGLKLVDFRFLGKTS